MEHAERRALALAILTTGEGLSRQAGSFLGQVVTDSTPLTEKQQSWFGKLAERAGLPENGGVQ
jgi:hypothetical protein